MENTEYPLIINKDGKTIETPNYLFDDDISPEEIHFCSDCEGFKREHKEDFINKIVKNKLKLIVLIGDIFDFCESNGRNGWYNDIFCFFDNPILALEIFLRNPFKNIKEKDRFEFSEKIVGELISNYLSKQYKELLNNFFQFMKECKKRNVKVIFFSGNHDNLLSHSQIYRYSNIPIINKIINLENLYIPRDLEIIGLNKEHFLMGIHTQNNTQNSKNYHIIKDFIDSSNKIIHPEKIIFISHLPSTYKFTNLGSEDISNFKKLFKFGYHYHGHCKDYHGEYIEEGIKTRSVHF